MEKRRLTSVNDYLAETITEVVESEDGKYWAVFNDDGNPVRLELGQYEIKVNDSDNIIVEVPFRLLDMSAVIRYAKLDDGTVNIAEVALNGPKASDCNFKDKCLDDLKGESNE